MSKRMLGDIAIDIAIEIPVDDGFPAEMLVPDFKTELVDANRDLLMPFCINPKTQGLKLSIHTWVVKTGHHTILIDTCNGNHKNRPTFELAHQLNTPYLERLAAVGVHPEEVDIVLCTHLHVDHCGWNTQLKNGKWVPTFPKAKYIFSRQEYDQWNPANPDCSKNPVNEGVFNDSVLPVVEAGQAQMIEGNHTLDDQMHIEPAPGHTQGSIVVKVHSKGQHALFAGDTMHSPVQILRPDWSSGFCDMPEQAAQTRRKLLEHCVEKNALLMPAHFPPPHAVRVTPKGEYFTFTPE
ncbi:MAG: MBL fold metallo-hydrolase [Gammaproteobacteria bacterium]|nr:MBL fold metallo-hydrolase [Gammaproteobacteria bacterium]